MDGLYEEIHKLCDQWCKEFEDLCYEELEEDFDTCDICPFGKLCCRGISGAEEFINEKITNYIKAFLERED